jgi:hypothetical protein
MTGAALKAEPPKGTWLDVHRRAHHGHEYPCYGPRGCVCGLAPPA